ncbi:MAG: hypothetical protein ACFFD7_07295 [Candidatus Thorarchaeota archaeon]
MNEFRVNRYITVKLENNQTNIYIAGSKFIQCKHLLLKYLITEELEEYAKNFTSIDEESENLDISLEDFKEIPPETEFWAHCSNLQAWAENKYDTFLIHYTLSFDILKELTKHGDIKAINVFREEIIKRILHGYLPVFCYLFYEGFLNIFTTDQLQNILKEVKRKDYRIFLIYLTILMGESDFNNGLSPSRIKKFTRRIETLLELNFFEELKLRDPEVDDFTNALSKLKQKIKKIN